MGTCRSTAREGTSALWSKSAIGVHGHCHGVLLASHVMVVYLGTSLMLSLVHVNIFRVNVVVLVLRRLWLLLMIET